MPFGIGPLELIILLVIVLMIFGPKQPPQLGRSLGGGMREFKDSVTGKNKDDDEPDVIEGPDRSNVTTTAAADDEETETARRSARPRPPTPPSPPAPSEPEPTQCPASSRSSTRTACRSSSTSTSCARGSSSARSSFVARVRPLLLAERPAARHRQRPARDEVASRSR